MIRYTLLIFFTGMSLSSFSQKAEDIDGKWECTGVDYFLNGERDDESGEFMNDLLEGNQYVYRSSDSSMWKTGFENFSSTWYLEGDHMIVIPLNIESRREDRGKVILKNGQMHIIDIGETYDGETYKTITKFKRL